MIDWAGKGKGLDMMHGRMRGTRCLGAAAVVLALLSGCSSAGGDGSGVAEPDPNAGIPDSSGTDHDSLKALERSDTLEQLDIDYSGDPADLYVVVSMTDGSEASVTTETVDENGEKVTEDFRDLTDSLTVLTPEQTGLTLEEGRTGLGPIPSLASSVCEADAVSDRGGGGPNRCPYVVKYIAADGSDVAVIVTDGAGQVIENRTGQLVTRMVPLAYDGTSVFRIGENDE